MRQCALIAVMSVVPVALASAGVASHAAKAVGRSLAKAGARQETKQLVREGAEQAVKEGAKTAARRSLVLTAHHFGQAAVHSSGFVDDLARASSHLSPRSQRRLMMLAPEIGKTGKSATVVKNLATSGNADDVIAHLWAHRGKLVAAGAMTGLLVHGDDIAEAGGKYVAKPLIEGSMQHVAAPLTASLVRVLWLLGLAAAAAYVVLRVNNSLWGRFRAWLNGALARRVLQLVWSTTLSKPFLPLKENQDDQPKS